MKFLHLADTHLGCRRYNLDERTKDFARAWYDIAKRYAVGRAVDFVLIAGDFFNQRNVDAQTMNHAMGGLNLLKRAGIPVIVIEGNHDKHDVTGDHSWLRSLSDWDYVKLLEPRAPGVGEYAPWNETSRSGWYIDIGEARIFGSHWYGMSANHALPQLADELKKARVENRFNILMLHTDVEGQLGRPIPALSVARLHELRSVVDYVALGHTHKKFELDDWAFNPGSPEWCSTDEFKEARGCYLVEVDAHKKISTEYLTDYTQRPLQRITFDVSGIADAGAVHTQAVEKIYREAKIYDAASGKPAPIIEIYLHGHLGFKNSLLNLKSLEEETKRHANALHVLLKNATVPVEYAVAVGLNRDHTSRAELEHRIIEDLITRDNRFRSRAPRIASLVVEAKRLALTGESPDKILALIEAELMREDEQDASANPTQTQVDGEATRTGDTLMPAAMSNQTSATVVKIETANALLTASDTDVIANNGLTREVEADDFSVEETTAAAHQALQRNAGIEG